MSDSITFTVPGKPVPWHRTEARRFGGRRKSDADRAYQERIAWAFLQAKAGAAWDSTDKKSLFVISALAVYPNRQHLADYDNLAKQIGDALQGAAYPNDRAVFDGQVRRMVRPPKSKIEGFLRVTIRRMPEGSDVYREKDGAGASAVAIVGEP